MFTTSEASGYDELIRVIRRVRNRWRLTIMLLRGIGFEVEEH